MRDVYVKKALYKAKYRSSKEADRIIGRYVESACSTMGEETLETLLEFLELEDYTILSMLAGKQAFSPEYEKFIVAMRSFSHV